ncbi:MAG: hypothetical protein LBC18_03130 [Opitutaceae bacterium]|nr:hypothetical protein [Opitutaceae bacterium]
MTIPGLPEPSPRPKVRRTALRQSIWLVLLRHQGQARLSDILSGEIGQHYPYNGAKHLGAALCRLVRAGGLMRIKRGTYALPSAHPVPKGGRS